MVLRKTEKEPQDDLFDITLVVTTQAEENKEEKEILIAQFARECLCSGVLDSACNANVCGQKWMEHYTANLSEEQKNKVEEVETSNKNFVFGNMGILKTIGTYKIPAMLAGKKCNILINVVDSGIPLLLSRMSMSKVKMTIDYGTSKVEIAGRRVRAFETTTGHLCILLR